MCRERERERELGCKEGTVNAGGGAGRVGLVVSPASLNHFPAEQLYHYSLWDIIPQHYLSSAADGGSSAHLYLYAYIL